MTDQNDSKRNDPLVASPSITYFNMLLDNVEQEHAKLRQFLVDLENDGGSDKSARDLVAQLAAYLSQHFSAEEKFMQFLAYPLAARHKRIHQKLLFIVGQLLASNATEAHIALFLRDFIPSWISDHVDQFDNDLLRFATRRNRC